MNSKESIKILNKELEKTNIKLNTKSDKLEEIEYKLRGCVSYSRFMELEDSLMNFCTN
jgi:hypothetical protein